MSKKQKVIFQLSDRIIEIVDNQDKLTRSDLQAMAEAIISLAYEKGKEE